MARLFTDSTNIVITTVTTESVPRSYAAWTYRQGDGGGGFGRVFDRNAATLEIPSFFSSAALGAMRFVYHWSTQRGDWTVPRPSLNDWHHLLVTYDRALTSNVPVIYVDGVAQTLTTLTSPSGTASTSTTVPLTVGNRHPDMTSNRGWAGRLAEVAIWDRLLTASEAHLLGLGYSPLFLPDGLVSYEPMVRSNVNRRRAASTVLGTTIAPHTRIRLPSPRSVPKSIAIAGQYRVIVPTARKMS
jgi:Concanavalin A-like lectin/glucanases superfamily